MIKKYYLIFIIGICIVLTITMGIKYRERKLLEAHISGRINQDIFKLVSNTIIENNEIVKEILESGEVRIDQRYTLHGNLLFPLDSIPKIRDASNKINCYDLDVEEQLYSITRIRYFFGDLSIKYDKDRSLKDKEVLTQLDDPLRKQFETVNRIFNGWVNSIDNLKGVVFEDGELLTTLDDYDNYYGRYSIKNKDWISFIKSLEEETYKALEDLSLELSPSNWMNLYESEKKLIQRNLIDSDRRSVEKLSETDPDVLFNILGAKILDELLLVEDRLGLYN
ncbi:UNVERIFIED_CONTAM: hypothetical protein Cloal_3205 [Acetivibrio alkalicellulosi]